MDFDLTPTFRLKRGPGKKRPPRGVLAVAAAFLVVAWAVVIAAVLEDEVSEAFIAAFFLAFIVYSAGYTLFLFDIARNPSLTDRAATAWGWAIYLLPLAPVAYWWRHVRTVG